MFDPRLSLLEKKLENTENIILFGSGKGGVGKSVISSAASYILSETGYNVAYIDLDFYGPSSQNLFPVGAQFKGGRGGIELPVSNNVRVMSIGYMLGDKPFPITGKEKIDLLIDLFSILNFPILDFMVIDLPPGMGDELTFTQRLFRDKISMAVVTTGSELSLNVVSRLVKYLRVENIHTLGVIINMANLFGEYSPIQIGQKLQLEVLGTVSYYPELEQFKTVKEKIENVPGFRKQLEGIVDGILDKLNL